MLVFTPAIVVASVPQGTAEREVRFQQMKQEVAAAGGGTGSFFAFHGSGPGNWHGILHLGLKNMSGDYDTDSMCARAFECIQACHTATG